jgi:dolichol kinase
LAAYKFIGYPRVMAWLWAWSAIVVVGELSRLYFPSLNKALLGPMAAFSRPEEQKRVSGIFHTTLGVLFLFLMFGATPIVVSASIFCVAFGDSAAALVGKSIGRIRLFGGKKSLEGSTACWAACFLSCWSQGFSAGSSALAALACAVVEFLPTTAWFNDNLWMPVAAGCILRILG